MKKSLFQAPLMMLAVLFIFIGASDVDAQSSFTINVPHQIEEDVKQIKAAQENIASIDSLTKDKIEGLNSKLKKLKNRLSEERRPNSREALAYEIKFIRSEVLKSAFEYYDGILRIRKDVARKISSIWSELSKISNKTDRKHIVAFANQLIAKENEKVTKRYNLALILKMSAMDDLERARLTKQLEMLSKLKDQYSKHRQAYLKNGGKVSHSHDGLQALRGQIEFLSMQNDGAGEMIRSERDYLREFVRIEGPLLELTVIQSELGKLVRTLRTISDGGSTMIGNLVGVIEDLYEGDTVFDMPDATSPLLEDDIIPYFHHDDQLIDNILNGGPPAKPAFLEVNDIG